MKWENKTKQNKRMHTHTHAYENKHVPSKTITKIQWAMLMPYKVCVSETTPPFVPYSYTHIHTYNNFVSSMCEYPRTKRLSLSSRQLRLVYSSQQKCQNSALFFSAQSLCYCCCFFFFFLCFFLRFSLRFFFVFTHCMCMRFYIFFSIRCYSIAETLVHKHIQCVNSEFRIEL